MHHNILFTSYVRMNTLLPISLPRRRHDWLPVSRVRLPLPVRYVLPTNQPNNLVDVRGTNSPRALAFDAHVQLLCPPKASRQEQQRPRYAAKQETGGDQPSQRVGRLTRASRPPFAAVLQISKLGVRRYEYTRTRPHPCLPVTLAPAFDVPGSAPALSSCRNWFFRIGIRTFRTLVPPPKQERKPEPPGSRVKGKLQLGNCSQLGGQRRQEPRKAHRHVHNNKHTNYVFR